jgi:hypothetical protein
MSAFHPLRTFAARGYVAQKCHSITLIALTDDAGSVGAIMERHGRAADPVDNSTIRRVLRSVSANT